MQFILLFLVYIFHLEALWRVNEPSLVLYSQRTLDSEIEDILPYSSQVILSDVCGEWVFVNSLYTDWQGWTLKKSLLEVKENPLLQTYVFVGYRGAYVYSSCSTTEGILFELPYEVSLNVVEECQDRRWLQVQLHDNRLVYVQRGQVSFDKLSLTEEEMCALSLKFLDKKYLYGGSTSFGYDCSGFVQMLYRQVGVAIPRNASKQACSELFEEIEFEKVREGDLIFFQNETQKVVHVGMILSSKEFIHSYPKEHSCVSIGSLNDPKWSNGEAYFKIFFKRLKSCK